MVDSVVYNSHQYDEINDQSDDSRPASYQEVPADAGNIERPESGIYTASDLSTREPPVDPSTKIYACLRKNV